MNTKKYEGAALVTIRTIQRQHELAGHTLQTKQMKRVGDQVEKMAEELAALKASAKAQRETDLIFLRELQGRIDRASEDTTMMDYAKEMVRDWIDELARASSRRGDEHR